MLEIKSFYKEYEDMFEEYLDDVKRILRKKNQQYIKLQEKYNNQVAPAMMEKFGYKNIMKI